MHIPDPPLDGGGPSRTIDGGVPLSLGPGVSPDRRLARLASGCLSSWRAARASGEGADSYPRHRPRRDGKAFIHMYTYIFIYVYTKREKNRDRNGEREQDESGRQPSRAPARGQSRTYLYHSARGGVSFRFCYHSAFCIIPPFLSFRFFRIVPRTRTSDNPLKMESGGGGNQNIKIDNLH